MALQGILSAVADVAPRWDIIFYLKLIITSTLYSRFKYQREHWHLGIGLAQGVGRWLLLFHRATGNFCRLTCGTVGWEQSTFISRQEIFYQV